MSNYLKDQKSPDARKRNLLVHQNTESLKVREVLLGTLVRSLIKVHITNAGSSFFQFSHPRICLQYFNLKRKQEKGVQQALFTNMFPSLSLKFPYNGSFSLFACLITFCLTFVLATKKGKAKSKKSKYLI